MSGNGGKAADNTADKLPSKAWRTSTGQFARRREEKEPAYIVPTPEPWAAPAGVLDRPHPNSAEYREWANNLLEKPAPPGFVKYVMRAGMGLKHAVNAFIGSERLDPRCRLTDCHYHGFGAKNVTNCSRGQAGSGTEDELYARGPLYMTSDTTRAGEYAAEAGNLNPEEDKTHGAVLTFVVIVPADKIFITTKEEVLASHDRNAWWAQNGFSMILVTNSMGNYLSAFSGYDAAVMDLSLVNIVHIHPCYSSGISAEWGLAFNEASDGVIITNPAAAARIGIFATKEMADNARRVSLLPWDVYDRQMEERAKQASSAAGSGRRPATNMAQRHQILDREMRQQMAQQDERERQERERQERERQQRERQERERQERERQTRERQERERQERVEQERERQERVEQERERQERNRQYREDRSRDEEHRRLLREKERETAAAIDNEQRRKQDREKGKRRKEERRKERETEQRMKEEREKEKRVKEQLGREEEQKKEQREKEEIDKEKHKKEKVDANNAVRRRRYATQKQEKLEKWQQSSVDKKTRVDVKSKKNTLDIEKKLSEESQKRQKTARTQEQRSLRVARDNRGVDNGRAEEEYSKAAHAVNSNIKLGDEQESHSTKGKEATKNLSVGLQQAAMNPRVPTVQPHGPVWIETQASLAEVLLKIKRFKNKSLPKPYVLIEMEREQSHFEMKIQGILCHHDIQKQCIAREQNPQIVMPVILAEDYGPSASAINFRTSTGEASFSMEEAIMLVQKLARCEFKDHARWLHTCFMETVLDYISEKDTAYVNTMHQQLLAHRHEFITHFILQEPASAEIDYMKALNARILFINTWRQEPEVAWINDDMDESHGEIIATTGGGGFAHDETPSGGEGRSGSCLKVGKRGYGEAKKEFKEHNVLPADADSKGSTVHDHTHKESKEPKGGQVSQEDHTHKESKEPKGGKVPKEGGVQVEGGGGAEDDVACNDDGDATVQVDGGLHERTVNFIFETNQIEIISLDDKRLPTRLLQNINKFRDFLLVYVVGTLSTWVKILPVTVLDVGGIRDDFIFLRGGALNSRRFASIVNNYTEKPYENSVEVGGDVVIDMYVGLLTKVTEHVKK